MNIEKSLFGSRGSGEDVYKYTFTNRNQFEISIINYGAIITSLKIPDRSGRIEDIVLGFDCLEDYTSEEYLKNNPYFGAVIGRYANRISGGEFELNGNLVSLSINEGNNSLHGGPVGFDRKVWIAEEFIDNHSAGLILKHRSPDGDQGYPGNLDVELRYIITEENVLAIEYSATSDKDTVVSLTNHSYFNLSGEGTGDIRNHRLLINSGKYLEIDDDLIPTGRLADVSGTGFDFSRLISIADAVDIKNSHENVDGYSHTYLINKEADDPNFAARLEDPLSGRVMEVFTTEPGILFYSGYGLDGRFPGKSGRRYMKNAGLCLETQQLPDAPNNDNFHSAVLRTGQEFKSRTEYRFTTDREMNNR